MGSESVELIISALSDSTRRKLFEEIVRAPQVVGDLAETTHVSRSAVSQHLRVLREAGLVFEKKTGRNVRYESSKSALNEMLEYIKSLLGSNPLLSAQGKVGGQKKNSPKLECEKADIIDKAMQQWASWSLNYDPKVLSTITRMRLLSERLERKYKEVAGRFGLVAGEAIILGTLRRINSTNGITPSELARASVVAPPSLAKHLRTLEDKGLIEREGHPVDKRSHRVFVNRKGTEVADLITQEQLLRQYAVLFEISKERLAVLDETFKKMLSVTQ